MTVWMGLSRRFPGHSSAFGYVEFRIQRDPPQA